MSDTTATTPEENLAASKSHGMQAAEELRDAASLKAEELKQTARERAENMREFATDKAHEARDYAADKAQEARHYAEERYQEARTVADEYRVEGERYVRENPAKSVLIALGIGFVVGRILR